MRRAAPITAGLFVVFSVGAMTALPALAETQPSTEVTTPDEQPPGSDQPEVTEPTVDTTPTTVADPISGNEKWLASWTILVTSAVVGGVMIMVYRLASKAIAAARADGRALVLAPARMPDPAADKGTDTKAPPTIVGPGEIAVGNSGQFTVSNGGSKPGATEWKVTTAPTGAGSPSAFTGEKLELTAAKAGAFYVTAVVVDGVDGAEKSTDVGPYLGAFVAADKQTDGFGVPIGGWGSLVLAILGLGLGVTLAFLGLFDGAVATLVAAALGVGAVGTYNQTK